MAILDGFHRVLVSSVTNPAFLSLIEPFSYAYFAAGNISVGFTPASGTFGSGSFGVIEGPSMNAVNLALSKRIPVFRESSFELRGSFTNVLNHTNFGDPNVTINTTGVGQITSTTSKSFGGPRAGLISGRFVF